MTTTEGTQTRRIICFVVTTNGGIEMAKKGMARPEWTDTKPRNEVPPVPQIQGKAKHGKENAKPIIEGSSGPDQKVFH